MQLAATAIKPSVARVTASRRSSRRAVVCSAAEPAPVTRRSALSSLVALPALLAAAPALAFGKDPRTALKEKEERRAKLRESAAKMKSTGKADQAFADSNYSLSEENAAPRGSSAAKQRGE